MRSRHAYARHVRMKRGRYSCGPPQKDLVQLDRFSDPVLVAMLETGFKKSSKQRAYMSLVCFVVFLGGFLFYFYDVCISCCRFQQC